MTRTVLPPGLVRLINALYHGLDLEHGLYELAEEELEQFETWWEAERGFWLHPEEREQLGAIRQHLDEIKQTLPTLDWQRLDHHLTALDGLMEAVNQRRARNPYSPLPALHHCILASGAVLIGQGDWDWLPTRWHLVSQYLTNLEWAFGPLLDQLDAERHDSVVVGLEKAREAVQRGLAGVEFQDEETVRQALEKLRSAGEVLEFLPRWHQQGLSAPSRFRIPLIAGRLEQDLQGLRDAPPEDRRVAAETRLEETLPILESYLAQEGPGVLLPAEHFSIWQEIAGALDSLRAVYEEMASSPSTPVKLEAALSELSSLFEELDEVRLRPEGLVSELAQKVAVTAQGVLRGQMPDTAVERLLPELDGLPAWHEVATLCRAYLEEADPGVLHQLAFAAERAATTVSSGGPSLSYFAE